MKVYEVAEKVPGSGEYVLGHDATGSHACYLIYGVLKAGEKGRELKPGRGHEEMLVVVRGELTVTGASTVALKQGQADGWKPVVVDDPDSNVFHKAIPWDGAILTIGGNKALLRTWRFADGAWMAETHWNPVFGGKHNRLRDVEHADVDGDGREELVLATHDQGVIAIVHPDEQWRVEEVDKTPNTFVHEIEIGDVDGDGALEFFATPSHPNKLDQEQPGEVVMFRREGGKWAKSVVDAPGDTHAKEILTAPR